MAVYWSIVLALVSLCHGSMSPPRGVAPVEENQAQVLSLEEQLQQNQDDLLALHRSV
jgi:hypothetical protein